MSGVCIVNTTKNTVLAERVELATSFVARLRGLLWRAPLAEGEGLLLRPTNQIHMFFMAFPLDVVFLDRGGRVLRVFPGLAPWRVTPPVWGAWQVLELPVGALARSRTEVDDMVTLM